MLHISVGNPGPSKCFLLLLSLMLQQTVVNMRNRTQYLTVLQFDLCGVQGDKLDHYRKGAVPEQQMFPISYVKGCKNIHQYTPGMGELVLVSFKTRLHSSRMRTTRTLTISPSMLCAGACMVFGGVHGSWGCIVCWGDEADPPCEQNNRQV